MPYAPKRPCSHPGCPKLSSARFCQAHQQQYDKGRNVRRGQAANSVLRKKIKERDGNRCRKCGSTEQLEVHHRIPISEGGHRTDPSNLITLCHNCHKQMH